MALPSSGQLSLKDISVELGIAAGNQASLHSMSLTAGKTVPDTVNEFHGYSAGDSITASFTNLVTISNSHTLINEYYTLNLAGLNTASIRPRIRIYVYSVSSGASLPFYWSINSTSSWTSFFTLNSTGTYYYNIPTLGYVDSGETLRLRWYGGKSIGNTIVWTVYIQTTGYTVGSGSVSSFSLGSPNSVGRTWS